MEDHSQHTLTDAAAVLRRSAAHLVLVLQRHSSAGPLGRRLAERGHIIVLLDHSARCAHRAWPFPFGSNYYMKTVHLGSAGRHAGPAGVQWNNAQLYPRLRGMRALTMRACRAGRALLSLAPQAQRASQRAENDVRLFLGAVKGPCSRGDFGPALS